MSIETKDLQKLCGHPWPKEFWILGESLERGSEFQCVSVSSDGVYTDLPETRFDGLACYRTEVHALENRFDTSLKPWLVALDQARTIAQGLTNPHVHGLVLCQEPPEVHWVR